jgi:crotonobetainyl-CoA:carnitine CoA-transferase CaiB-like acyl-CoA transferase
VKRVQHRTALQLLLQDKLAHYSSDEVLTNMMENNVPCGKIKNLEEVFNDNSAKELIRSELIEGKETKRVTSIAFKWK